MKTTNFTLQNTAILLALLPSICGASDANQPTADEQVLLERVNAARVQQAEESRRLHLDFQEGMSYPVQANLQPLIWRTSLKAAATEHNQDMWARDYYGHVTPDGRGPFQQVQAHDADFLAVGQDLGAGRMYTTPDSVYKGWMVDAGIENRGHRQCILHSQIDSFGAQRSSSYATFYGVYWTAYFGVSLSRHHYVTGVIYNDLNRNGRYDAGEGLPHWKVRLVAQSPETTVSATQTISSNGSGTSAAMAAGETEFVSAYDTGGYAVEAPAEGDYTVEAVSPDGESFFDSTGIDSANVKVDFVVNAGRAISSQATTPAKSSGKQAGCALVEGRSQTAWTLLAAMGLLLAAILGLRMGSH
ncbi:MAG TPA: CAP domain-containing protein [Planctomycetota bacterium]|nr:CAP domain-containing protein [Planctomycetota bacterium]